MYRVPLDLDLSQIVGHFTTLLRVGQFDLQFTFGPVSFAVQSPISLVKNGAVSGRWREGKWPEPSFFDLMNVAVSRWEIPNDHSIVIGLDNGIEIHLVDDSDAYECMQISFEGDPVQRII
jgi:hypothetical protein